jgi:hypothetical protein
MKRLEEGTQYKVVAEKELNVIKQWLSAI